MLLITEALWRIIEKDLHEPDELTHGLRALGLQVLVPLHILHLAVQLHGQRYKLFLVCLLIQVELDNSLLEDIEQRIQAVVV